MSKNENLPVVEQTTDLSLADEQRIQKFIENGAKGYNLSDEVTITKMMDLYLGGKTYSQIARITRSPKELVMAYSKQLDWFDLKNEYLLELQASMRGRVMASKMASQDFLLQLSQMFQKKIGSKMDAYMNTGNAEHADAISTKEIESYLKTVKALNELSDPAAPKSDKPLVGLNVGDGATLTKNDDGSIDITPKAKVMGSMLEQLANKRRETEEAARVAAVARSKPTSDINEVAPVDNKEKGDKGEK